ncbi:MAG: pilus assembly protein, partial [Comamonas sp.]
MRKHHAQRGAALIELALAIPFMILLSMIVIEFGRALYEYSAVTKSVRDAVRYLSNQ